MSTPSYAEIAAQLTAPGAPFELTTRDGARAASAACFAQPRALAAREGRERGPARRRRSAWSTASAASRTRDFARGVWGAARALARGPRPRAGRPPRGPLLQLPGLAHRALRRGLGRRHRRRAQRLVGDRGDRLRPRATRAAASWSSTSACSRASSRCSAASPASRRSSTSATNPPRGHACRSSELLEPARRAADDADRRGRPVRAALHLGHDGPLEGLHHHAPRHDRAGAGHPVRERRSARCSPARPLLGRRAAASPRRCSPRRSSTSAGSTRASARRSPSARSSCSARAASTPSR